MLVAITTTTVSSAIGRRRALVVLGIACGLVCGLLAAPRAAAAQGGLSATGGRGLRSGGVLVKTGMQIVGFDAAVAAAHGYRIRVDAHGVRYTARRGSTASPDADPRVWGSCGDSYIYYKAVGSRRASPHYEATYDTGYDVIDLVWDGYWQASFVDADGVGTLSWKYAANGTPSWSTSGYTFHTPTGYSWAEVDPSSWVELDNGAVCTSLGPWDDTTLY
jgi:hypothetical protein